MEKLEQLVDDLHLEDLRNELHPSFFDENDGYDMLIVRLPIINATLEAKSIGFVIADDKSYLYDKTKKLFDETGDKFEGPYKILDKILDKFLKSFTYYQDTVADLEENMYEDKVTDDFMKNWLALKKDIVRIERLLLRSSLTIDELIEFYEHEEAFPINHYIDLHEHMERTMRSAGLQLSKLDYLYSFYTARTNDKMNKMIFILTLLSAVFLPLNLVVGFFGMNTSGLPFAGGSMGTLNAVLLMVSLLLVSSGVLYLWKGKTDKNI
ncbi:MAG: CorA family divalent cation transporter [Sulfurimonas sp.]|uniref:CorA family divalent cation transporter n=1 Tax=Sulfurimonas sp. TaxID=2022749 RepID=UPI002620464E|nr:CorA family divalent cation transporter [Sulfurimonas sp.]MCW8896071.1 CorA family divalent cation transporter [Sulfurimonas sp.]MCW8954998.1 CorA family divalent cation transporter [Sulfurimonas sp.]MCW9067628.1 CorA family divalent cation transporter [Sulfurimonas sp.]